MVRRYVFVGLAVLWGIVGLSGAESWASDGDLNRASLRGLSGVYVLIEHLEPTVERGGLTEEQIQTDVELRLRHAGIVVLTKEEMLKTPGKPSLYVRVTVFLHSSGLAAYSIHVELDQMAHLETDDSFTSASTWSTGNVGTVGVANLRTLRDPVRDTVDKFINAYLSVHPRPAGSVAPPVSPVASSRQPLIRRVQERLQAAGFNPGTIDGTIEPQTRNALRWFQNTKGLLATGELNQTTQHWYTGSVYKRAVPSYSGHQVYESHVD